MSSHEVRDATSDIVSNSGIISLTSPALVTTQPERVDVNADRSTQEPDELTICAQHINIFWQTVADMQRTRSE